MARARRLSEALATTNHFYCVTHSHFPLIAVEGSNVADDCYVDEWIYTRLKLLASIFAIELCAASVSRHFYHIVLQVSPDDAQGWDDDEVIKRWHSIFQGTSVSRRYMKGKTLSLEQGAALKRDVVIWRARLYDCSWFMRCCNEYIARRAKSLLDRSGKFWNGRFKSKPLVSSRDFESCTRYVSGFQSAKTAVQRNDSTKAGVLQPSLRANTVKPSTSLPPLNRESSDRAAVPAHSVMSSHKIIKPHVVGAMKKSCVSDSSPTHA